LEASAEIDGLHFWSWGYGYLYTVKTSLWVDGKKVDEVATVPVSVKPFRQRNDLVE